MMAMRPSTLLRASATLGHTQPSIPKVSIKFEMPEGVPTQTHIDPFVKHPVSYVPRAEDFKRTVGNILPWAAELFTIR